MTRGAPGKPAFAIRSMVWRYPGDAGWFFVNTGPKVAESIRWFEEVEKVGWGYVKVLARIGETEWATTLFPTKEKDFLLAIKAAVRKAEGIKEGDLIDIRFTLSMPQDALDAVGRKARGKKEAKVSKPPVFARLEGPAMAPARKIPRKPT
jgi:hypothetical protein